MNERGRTPVVPAGAVMANGGVALCTGHTEPWDGVWRKRREMTEDRIKELKKIVHYAVGTLRGTDLPEGADTDVEALASAVEELLEDIARQRESRKALADSNVQLYQENGRLRVALKGYAQHKAGCPLATLASGEPCTCGLDALLAQAG